jgi:hypothetical protein
MPPRAVSNTAASTSGCSSTLRALLGPLQSPLSIWRPFTYTPSVLVMPTRRPWAVNRWAIRRAVVVLPLVPVTATTGMRPSSPGRTAVHHGLAHVARLAVGGRQVHAQAGGGVHFDDAAALLFERAQHGFATTSTPQMCRPTICAAATARAATSGCTSSVTSVAVPPVDRLALLRRMTRWPLAAPIGRQVLRGQAGHGDVVEADLGQRGGVASPRRGSVDHVHQLAHGVLAVAQHLGRLAAGGGHQLVAHHQQAEVVAGQEALDHHVAVFGGVLVGASAARGR